MTALLSIDVEDWFHVENLKSGIPRASWKSSEFRVHRNVELILNILEKNNTRATFFVLGWVARRLPHLVRQIFDAGHEIASHGYGHEMIPNLEPRAFYDDVKRSKHILESITGKRVFGYRAPNFSITDRAIDTLIDLGFAYDSSLFLAFKHDRYGKLNHFTDPKKPYFEMKNGFYQVLPSCLTFLGKNIPWGGGAYFRLFPFSIFRRGIHQILHEKALYCFYIHPWEFDPDQPRVRNVSLNYRFRHYNNLQKTEKRFAKLVREFKFEPINTILPIH